MIKKLLSMVTLVTLLSTPVANYGQAPTLGSASGFVLFTTVGAVGNTSPSYLTGNVGSNSGSSTGFGNVNGVMSNNNGTTAAAAADVLTAYNTLNSAIPGFFPSSLLGNGGTLTAGVYNITGTSSLSNTLTLDGQNNPNAVFIFQLGGAFSTGAGSVVKLINGALACNVFWKVEGLVSMATGTKMKGTIIANNAAITMSSGVDLEGRALSTNGAITLNNTTASLPIGCGSPTLTGPAAPALGAAGCYAILSGNGPVSNSGVSYATGDIGTNVGLTTGHNALTVTGIIHPIPDGSTNGASTSLLSAYNYLNTLPYDIELLYPAQFGNSLVLTPHVYRMNGAVTFNDTLYLNAAGNANAVFVIQVNGAFSTSTNAKVALMNGAQAQNIFWKIEGAVNLNSNVNFKGTIIANNGAISLSSGVLLSGRALTTNGALGTSAVTVNIPGSTGNLSITASSSLLCPGFNTTITASGSSYYLWSNNSTASSIVVNPSTTTSYSVTGTYTSSGCTNIGIKTISVSPTPVIVASSASICAGSSYTIITSGASTYTITGGTTTVTPGSTTSYSVSGTSSAGCLSALAGIATVSVYAKPIITVNSGTVCNGSNFIMLPGGASTYTYSSGSATVLPLSNTSYSVIGTSSMGCVAISSVVASVTVNPLPIISVNSGSICLGSTFTMVPTGASTYSYSSGSSTVAPAINSSYNVMGTSSLGCVSASAAVSSVTVVASPVVAVNSGTICSGQVFTMIPSGAVTYTFSNGSSTVSPLTNMSYSVTGSGPSGCLSYNTAVSTVVVNALPVVSVNSGSVCAGQSFTMIPSGAVSYTFANGSNVVTPAVTSTYMVLGTNANGCISASVALSTVTVQALPIVSVNSGSVCAGQSFTMTPSGAASYTFVNGSNVVTPSITSNYSVSGTDAAGCVSKPAVVSTVTVHALPVLVISSTSGTMCVGENVVITASGAVTYKWDNTQVSPSITVSPISTVIYTVTGTNINGCTSTSMFSQYVAICTGVNKNTQKSIAINLYPNPNSGAFSVDVVSSIEMIIMNNIGQAVYHQLLTPGVNQINSDLTNGVYFVNLGNQSFKMVVSGK